MAGGELAVNRAGSLVGSILESAGYIYQSSILDSIQGPFVDKVGGLVYLFAIVIIIFQMAVQRNAKAAAWLLIGPPIFFSVISNREIIDNARWSFGSSDRDPAKTAQGVNEISNGGKANVSKVFKMYVEMISASSAAMVDTIIRQSREEERKEDVWFLIKGELNSMLSSVREEDPGLLRLIQHGMLGECRAVVKAARGVDDPLARFNLSSRNALTGVLTAASDLLSPTRAAARAQYENLLKIKSVNLKNDTAAMRYIKNLYAGDADVTLDTTGLENGVVDNGKVVQEVGVVSCADIWGFILKGILKKAEVHRSKVVEKAKELGLEENVIQTLWLEASGIDTGNKIINPGSGIAKATPGAADIITRIIAKFYLRNEVRGRDAGSLLAEFVGKHDVRRLNTNLTGHMAYTEQARVASEEWSEKERLMYAASGLPYYQGVALYFLGMLFPFFAFLLLFPGKMGGFLLWFMLWMWVKSWDIALAVVMQLDDILWALLSVQKQELGKDERLPLDLQVAMTSLSDMDPTYQITVYYAILAVCILAIPSVTAQLLLGGMRGGASTIAQGVSRYSDFFSDAMLVGVQQGVVQRLHLDAKQSKQDYAEAYHNASQAGLIRNTPSAGGLDGVSSINLSKTGGGNGPGGMPGVGGQGYQGRAEAANSAASNIGYRKGVKQGPSGFLNEGSSQSNALGLGARGYQLPKALEGYIVGKEISRLQKERALDGAEAQWDANVAADTYQIYERMALFGAIPVPWAALVNDFADKEMERTVMEYQAEQGYGAEGISVLKQALTLAADTVSFGVGEREKYQQSVNQGNLQGALNSLNPSQMDQVSTFFKDQGKNIAHAGVLASLFAGSSGVSNEGEVMPGIESKDYMPEMIKRAFDNQGAFAEDIRAKANSAGREDYYDMRNTDPTQPMPYSTRAIQGGGRRSNRRVGADDDD